MKILIPVDGSDNSTRAVEYAVKLASGLREASQLLLLNVQWSVAAGNVKLFISQETINDYHREQGMAALVKARALLDEAKIPYQYHISVGRPAEAIMQYANEQAVDQIVIGAQGQETLANLLLGSISSKVVQLAKMPVTVTK